MSARIIVRVTGYQLRDVLRSRTLLAYGAFFLLVTEALLRFSGGDARALLSVMSVVLWVVPLVTLVYGTVYLYNAREFTELLLAQPVGRGQLFAGLYLGLALPLALGVVVGVGAPFLVTGVEEPAQRAALATLLVVAAALTAVFTAIAFCIALRFEDRLKGLGAAATARSVASAARCAGSSTPVMTNGAPTPTTTPSASGSVRPRYRPANSWPRPTGCARRSSVNSRALYR